MKKIFFILSIFIVSNLYSKDIFLKKLVENGYIDVAVNYCNENINEPECIKILKNYNRYNELIKLLKKREKTPDNLILLYECYIRTKRFKEADRLIDVINKFILTDSQEKKLKEIKNLYKAYESYYTYNYPLALSYFKKVQTLTKDDLKKEIRCLIFSGELKEAEKKIKKFKIKDYFLIGLLKYKLEEYNQALLYFKKSNNKEAKIYLYNCLVLTGKLSEAKNVFSIKNERPKNFFKKIQMLIDYEKYNEAQIRLNNYKDCFEKYFYLGIIFLNLNEFNKAKSAFLKSKSFRNSTKINFYTGLSCFKNYEYLNAIFFFKEGLKIQDSYEFYVKSLYYLGYSYLKVGKFDDSLSIFLKLINFPQSYFPIKDLYKKMATLYERKGDLVNAIEFYNKCYEISKDKKLLLKISNLAEKRGDFSYAIQILGNFLPVKNRKNSFILKRIADIYFKANDFKNSLIFYKKYLNYNRKEFSKISLKMGLCYLYSDHLKKAKLIFLKIVESQKKSKYRDEALYWLGLIFFKEKNFLKASIYFQRLYNANSSSFLTNQAIKYILICAIKQNDFQTFKKFIKIFPSPEEIVYTEENNLKKFCNSENCLKLLTITPEDVLKFKIFTKINYLISQNKLKNVKELAATYESYFKDNPIIYYKIGKFLYEKGHIDEAIFYFNHFLNLASFKNFSEIKYILAKVIEYHYKKKNFQNIIFYAEKFKNINLSHIDCYYVAKSYYNLKLNEKAKIYFNKYIANFNLKNDNLNFLFDSAFRLDNMNFKDDALKGYLKFLKFSNNKSLNVEALYWIGDIYYQKGYIEKALETFLKVKLLYKEYTKWSIQASFRAGNIFEKFGEKDKAIKEYRYIFYMLPDNDPRKIYIRNKLKKMKNEKS